MMKTKGTSSFFAWQWIVLWYWITLFLAVCDASIVLNEIAYKGSGNDQCNGKDWIELLNSGSTEVNLRGYTIHDDKGKENEDATTFLSSMVLAPNELKVLCKEDDFIFGIGSSDTVTLLDNNGTVVGTVTLPGLDESNLSYAYSLDTNEYKYTTTMTPGGVNILTNPGPRKSLEEMLEEQNNAGNDFFLQFPDLRGTSETFNRVVDVDISMDESSLAEIKNNPFYENFVPFTQISVSNSDNEDVPIIVGGSGRIRTKGQSTLHIVACLKMKNLPFHVTFDEPFLGLETVIFRNSFGDESYMRDYAAHVMLAKFGLPYVRCRFVRLYLNGDYTGFYTMLEAPSHGFVMQRSFGAFDPSQTALFKFKTGSSDCPFPQDEVDKQLAANREVPDPYYFERGSHRSGPSPEIIGSERCFGYFLTEIAKERTDTVRGYIEYNNTCGLAMVNLGRVDRDYGPKTMEDPMISFLDTTYYNKSVIDITNEVDTDQWLKSIAFMASLLHLDSPLFIVNNFYLATTSGGTNDWRIVQYDHNGLLDNGIAQLCNENCNSRAMYWPILRPTCGPVEKHPIVGRVLNNEKNEQKYVEYVQELANIINPGFIDDLKLIGDSIKEYIVKDPLYFMVPDPFLTRLESRLEQVNAQLDAINTDTLPRGGIYGENEVCPDWRSSSGESFVPDNPLSTHCLDVINCYVEGCVDGKMVFDGCEKATPFCDFMYPDSPCATSDTAAEAGDGCADAAPCYTMGCVDGKMIFDGCEKATPFCDFMYPDSPCITSDSTASAEDGCASAAPCYNEGCVNGKMIWEYCLTLTPLCDHIFQDSACGSSKVELSSATTNETKLNGDDSSMFEPSSTNHFIVTLWSMALLAVTVLYFL